MRIRIASFVLAAALAGRSATAQQPLAADSTYRPEELRAYLMGTFGPRPTVRALALAGFDQWRGGRDSVPRTWRGFEDRLGERYAQVAISHTIRFGLARAFDERTIHYRPCACGDTASRAMYALMSPLRVNSPRGVHLSVLNPVSEIASGIIATSVRPRGFSVGAGVRNGVTGLLAESATSLLREYWPWHWRPPFL